MLDADLGMLPLAVSEVWNMHKQHGQVAVFQLFTYHALGKAACLSCCRLLWQTHPAM